MKIQLTLDSLSLFQSLVKDAGNWNDQPMIDITKEERGNLTQLKKQGLLTTSESDGIYWAHFTKLGATLAKEMCNEEITPTARENSYAI